MDSAPKVIKATALLFAIALLMAVPGFTQAPILTVPTSVSLSGTGGQTVSVTSSGAQITYAIGATQYQNDNNGVTVDWLAVSGGTTTPAQLSFGLSFHTAGLIQGTHQALVTLTPTDPTVAAVTITVTYTSGVSGGGGNGNGTLTANPNPINLSASSGGQTTTSVTLSTASTTAISVGVTAAVTSGGTNWLSASISGNTTISVGSPTTISVTANAVSLPNGTYQGNVTVNPGSQQLVIPVNFTVGGTGSGNGVWTVNPSTVSFNFNSGSGIFPSTSVAVTTTSGFTTYNATATSSNGWLLINGSPVANALSTGTSYSLSVGAQANVLSTGTYQGTVTILDPNNAQQVTISVTLGVNGGNSTGLTINPNPLTLTTAVNGAQQNSSVSVTSSTGGTLSISSASQPSWLTFQLPGNTSLIPGGSTAFSVNANPAGLGAGTYTASLSITVGSQSGTLNINMIVGSGGIGTGTTAVAPTSLVFTYQIGTIQAAIAQPRIAITGPAGSWSSVLNPSGSWLQLSPGSGSALPDASNIGSLPIVSITPTGLAVGTYTGTIAITTGGGTQNITVTLTVTSSPVLVPTPGSLVFAAQTGTVNPQPQQAFFSVTDPSVALAITATANDSFITVNASGGSMQVSVDATGKGSGVYNGSITINQNNVANNPYTFPVVMVVNGGGSGGGSGPLTFTPSSLAFSSSNGSTPGAQTLTVGASSSSTTFTFLTSYQSGSSWLSVTSLSNATGSNLTVSANPSGLSAGTYNATISFTSASGVIQTVPVSLTVGSSGGTGGNVTVSPTSLTFSGQAGGSSPAAQSLTVSSASGTSPVTFTVTPTTASGGTWLSTTANVTSSTPATFNVTATTASLAAGTYTGNLAIQPSGGTLVNVPVTLTVTASPTVTATPTSLTFNYRAGDSTPAAQPISVSGGGGALTFSATAASTGNWLVVSPTTGTTNASAATTVNASINPAGLAAGNYNGTITIAGTNGATGTTTISVSLTVTAPLPTVTKVTNAASYVAGTIAPGEIITLFAGDPTHPIGPATPVGLTLDSTGKVTTTLGGVQVLINGFESPMVFVSATQVSAVVPYDLARFTTATVLVKFLGQTSNGVPVNVVTTSPGLFSANSSGTGPGAILNSNNSVNSPANPATRGDTVVVYLTGEGQTSPAGVTGKVTTVSSTPPLTPGPLLPVSIKVGGQGANYSFAGEAPGFVSGVMQLNVTLPTNIGTGEQEIIVTIGGNDSQRGLTVSVK